MNLLILIHDDAVTAVASSVPSFSFQLAARNIIAFLTVD